MLLTGKNGAGKTSVLCEIAEVLKIWQKSQGESDQNYQRELDLMLQNESGQTPQIEVTLSKLSLDQSSAPRIPKRRGVKRGSKTAAPARGTEARGPEAVASAKSAETRRARVVKPVPF